MLGSPRFRRLLLAKTTIACHLAVSNFYRRATHSSKICILGVSASEESIKVAEITFRRRKSRWRLSSGAVDLRCLGVSRHFSHLADQAIFLLKVALHLKQVVNNHTYHSYWKWTWNRRRQILRRALSIEWSTVVRYLRLHGSMTQVADSSWIEFLRHLTRNVIISVNYLRIRLRQIEWQALRSWLLSAFWTYLFAEYLFPGSDCELQCVGRLLDGIALSSVRFFCCTIKILTNFLIGVIH